MKREENQTIEYKESWHEKYLEWICGYANAKGGTLYIGIEDKNKEPVGIPVVTPVMAPVATPVMAPVTTPVGRMLPERHMRILLALKDGEMASSEIVNVIDGIAPNNLRRRYMRYLLDAEYVEYTILRKPNSRMQKHRITSKGLEMLQQGTK